MGPGAKTRLLLRLLRSEGLRSVAGRVAFHARRGIEISARTVLRFPDELPRPESPQASETAVDVVVPVFGALAAARACLDSVMRHTDLSRHRLMVVDDGNRSPELLEWLEELAERGVEVLRSPDNRGFTAAANLGLRQSDRDVVLLNSDTQVSAGWLESMVQASRRPDTASVTALSNHATICTVPFGAQGPPRPDTETIERHARIVERTSLRASPCIPTPVGFCMLLTRAALDRVGLLDERGFPRGYGEENDWGWRARRLGLQHRVADAVFVYHEGQQSFSSRERRLRSRVATRRLERRYPEHRAEIGRFMAEDPLQLHRRAIEMLESEPRAVEGPGVLHLTGCDPGRPQGGVDHHVQTLRAGLRELGWSAAIAWVEGPTLRVLWGARADKVWTFHLPIGVAERAAIQRRILEYVCRALGIQVLHAHDARRFERPSLCELGLPLVLTFHDFQLYCSRPNLLESTTSEFCDYSRDAGRCRRCLAAAGPSRAEGVAGSAERWREGSARLIDRAAAFVAPSSFMARTIQGLFPACSVESRCRVIEHDRAAGSASAAPSVRRSPPRVAFVGQYEPGKGSRIFVELVRALASDAGVRFAILGGIVDHEALDAARSAARVETIGWYRRERLPGLLRPASDVVVLPSIVPESSSYTLSEALAAGVPVLAFDHGAVAERLKRVGRGDWLVPRIEGAAGFAERVRAHAAGRLSWPGQPQEGPWSALDVARRHVEVYRESLGRLQERGQSRS
jgi:GT2 family glycosyltransferase